MVGIRRYLKVGIVHFMAFPQTMRGEGPILETLEKIANDSFFDLVEVGWIKDPETRRRAREILEVSGLEVGYGVQPRLLIQGLDLNTTDEVRRREAVEVLKESVEHALELGAKRLAFLSGKDPGPEGRGRAKELLADSIQQVCDYASSRDRDFKVVLEIFDRDIDKRCLIGPSREAREVAELVGRDNFGLMHDLSHLPLLQEKPLEALSEVGRYLIHAHMGNCCLDRGSELYGDQHPRFGIKGGCVGVEEVVEYLGALKQVGYMDGRKPVPLTIEVKPAKGESSELVIANAKRTLLKAWERLSP
jgi:sugar phosphate isomerase/epimerase